MKVRKCKENILNTSLTTVRGAFYLSARNNDNFRLQMCNWLLWDLHILVGARGEEEEVSLVVMAAYKFQMQMLNQASCKLPVHQRNHWAICLRYMLHTLWFMHMAISVALLCFSLTELILQFLLLLCSSLSSSSTVSASGSATIATALR